MATKITGTLSGEPLIEVEIGGVFVPWKQAIDNWATVTAVTGSPTTGTYTDANGVAWKYYQWTSNGSVTTTAGLMDVLIVGGGARGGSVSGANYAGRGGPIMDGVRAITSGTHTVTVGAASSGDLNNPSRIGPLLSGVTGGYWGGAPNRTMTISDTSTEPDGMQLGLSSSITGSAVRYGNDGRVGQFANRGSGGAIAVANATAGVVILRVPSQFAQV